MDQLLRVFVDDFGNGASQRLARIGNERAYWIEQIGGVDAAAIVVHADRVYVITMRGQATSDVALAFEEFLRQFRFVDGPPAP